MTTLEKIDGLGSSFVKSITDELQTMYEKLDDYTIVWKQLQDIAVDKMCEILKNEIQTAVITSPKTKSTYPDIKIETEEGIFAIDVKTHEKQKDPWFDMARLDTIVEERLLKYKEEWELVIQYDSVSKQFLKAYFVKFREAVGIRNECKGVKYRPYDGKLRPKSWNDFDKQVIYWKDKDEFLIGIKNSIIHRWKKNIQEQLLPKLNLEQKEEFKKLFE